MSACLRPAVLHDVAQRLLGDTIDDGLIDVGQAPVILDLGGHRDPPCRHLRTEIGHGVRQPGRPQVRWIQFDEQRTSLAHRGTDALGAPLDRGLLRRVGGSVGGSCQVDGDPCERLDQPIVELARDPSPFLLGAVRGSLQQALAGLVAGSEVPRESPGERPLDDGEQGEPGEHEWQDLLGEESGPT